MLVPSPDKLHAATLAMLLKGNMRVHFSQHGEDVVLWQMLRQQKGGFYVDIGAHHPESISNTALLHHYNGWSGINVDPDQRVIKAFQAQRPNDVNLCCAIGPADAGTVEIAVFENPSINTCDPVAAERQKLHHKFRGWETVPVRTLRHVLEEHCPRNRPIDLLNVDVEGWEVAVLASNDWTKWQPSIVVVEDFKLRLNDVGKSEIYQFMTTQGYALASHLMSTSVYRIDQAFRGHPAPMV